MWYNYYGGPMKYLKKYSNYIIFTIEFMLLSMTFIPTNMEWSWNFDIINFSINYKVTPFVSILSLTLVNYKFFKILSYIILSLGFFITQKNLINKKNNSLFYMSIFSFFLLNQTILNECYLSTFGFIQNFITTLFILIIINYLENDNLYKLPKSLIVILGIISTSLNPVYSFLILAIVIYKIINNILNKEKNKSIYLLLISTIIGNIFTINNIVINNNISNKLLYDIVPKITNSNYIVLLITLLFIIWLSLKLLKKNMEKTKVSLSIGVSIIYVLIATFLHNNIYLNYIFLILHLISSYYIIYNSTTSHSFKEKIKLFYFIKVTFIIFSSIFDMQANISFIPAIMDIMIMLELINITLPTNYLQKPYLVISSVIIISQIIIGFNTKNRVDDMYTYLKRDLSCDIKRITLPSKYKEENMNIYLPQNDIEKENFLRLFNINNNFEYTIDFTK